MLLHLSFPSFPNEDHVWVEFSTTSEPESVDISKTNTSKLLPRETAGSLLGAGEQGEAWMLSFPLLCSSEEEQGTGGGPNRDREGPAALQLCVPPHRLGLFTTARKSTSTSYSRLLLWAWKNSVTTLCCSSLKPTESSGKVRTRQCWPPDADAAPRALPGCLFRP